MTASPDVLMPSAPRVPRRRRLLALGKKTLFALGVHRLWLSLRRDQGAIILMYHSVPGPEARPWIDPRNATVPEVFERQMRLLAERRKVVSLTELVDALEQGRNLATGSVVITFDDGYLDNCTIAAPILARLGLPASFFLATGYVNRGLPHWIDHLWSLYRARTAGSLDLRAHGGRTFELVRQPDVDASYALLCGLLLDGDMESRGQLFAGLERQLQPSRQPPRLTLDWNDVRNLLAMSPGFQVGVHTCDHVALPTRGPERIEQELQRCMADVRAQAGVDPPFFSFPYGRSCRVSRERAAARFRAAVVTEPPARVQHGTDRFALPRVQAPDDPRLFGLYTSGAWPDLTRFLLRRA